MILTKEEYLSLGFDGGGGTQDSGAENSDKLLTDCLKRAEYVLNGLTDGAAARTALRGGQPAEYVKQACGFQAQAMLRYEIARKEYESSIRESIGGSESESSKESESGSESSGSSQSSQNAEKVTIGDFSYSVSSGSSSGSSSSNSSGSSSSSGRSSSSSTQGIAEVIQPFETDTVVISLLRAAGCLFAAAEVRE